MRTRKWIVAIVCVLLTGSLFRIGALSVCMAGGNVIAKDVVVFENTAAAGSTEMSSDGDECNIGQKDDQTGTADTCPVSSATSSGTIIDAGGNTSPATPIGGGGVNPGGEIIPGGGIIPTTTYTIILDENWEGGMGQVLSGSYSYTLPSISRPGETFYGWATTPDGFPIYAAGDTVSPSEDMILYAIWIQPEFFVEDGVLKAYKGTGGDIVIPTGVTAIGDEAFAGYITITSIVLPAGVTTIGNKAFSGCWEMTNINIPAGVTTIGDDAFRGCISLTSITIPEGVTAIGDNAFEGCSSLTSITLPAGVAAIGDNAFHSCSSLTSITIPEGVTAIGDDAFRSCSSLTSITIPEGVTAIGNNAFRHCSSLTSITIPEGVTAIGDNAFYNCSSLTSISLPAGVTTIGYGAFWDCSSLTSISLPAGVTAIGYSAFNGCSSLTSVFIPESVNEISGDAFSSCPKLTIYAPAGSYAQRYAESNGYSFAIQNAFLKGTSVDLSDIINLKLYYAIDDALLESGVYAHIIYADGTDELQEITDELRYTDANGDESYIVNCRMAPKSIGDSISVQLCTESKSENYTSAFVYSVKQYCQDLLAEETCTDEEKTLIQAMLAYGTYSQLYFDYGTSALVIPESETEISSLEDVCDALTEIPETVSEGTLPEAITFYGSSLVLNSSIAYRMYFVAEDAENAETYGLVKSGTDGLYYIENETVSIAQVGDVLEYTVGAAVIRSCPLLYVKQVVNGAYSEELTNLCIAIYDYYKAAVRYAEGQR